MLKIMNCAYDSNFVYTLVRVMNIILLRVFTMKFVENLLEILFHCDFISLSLFTNLYQTTIATIQTSTNIFIYARCVCVRIAVWLGILNSADGCVYVFRCVQSLCFLFACSIYDVIFFYCFFAFKMFMCYLPFNFQSIHRYEFNLNTFESQMIICRLMFTLTLIYSYRRQINSKFVMRNSFKWKIFETKTTTEEDEQFTFIF